MTSKFRKEWRTIDPSNPQRAAYHYDNRAEASANAARYPWRVVQHRFVSDWKDDN